MKIKILYEDKNILAIDKPSGISVHPDGRSKEKTISDWFVKKYPKAKNVGESIFVEGKEIKKPGIVHRLDKETSGVLLLAKNQKAYEFLKNQFKNREIKKVYNAIVLGSVKNDRGTIRKSIGRSGNDFRKRLAGRGARGELREAITEYTVLKKFKDECVQNFSSCAQLSAQKGEQSGTLRDKNFVHTHPFSYLEVRPKTGRTHQIRVHMKFINHPVVNDSLYNPNQPHPKDFERLGLHAKSIEFKDLKGKIVKVQSPLPKEFESIINKA
ncbi:MAG: RluA family pseudouridine synthase [Candidatus Paceibacterota bacterium]